MANVMKLKDGTLHTIISTRDFEWLIEKYMGYEALRTFQEIIAEKEEELTEYKNLRSEVEDYVLRTLLPQLPLLNEEEIAEEFKGKMEDLYGIE